MRLKHRTAIITGAGSGIGRASALLFAAQGACVALVDRDAGGLQETMAALRAANSDGSVHVGDVSDADFAAKGAIVSLTRTMALDFATDGIRVNAIAPGAIDTPMLRRSFARHIDPEPVREASRNRHAMKRFGKAEEVAEAALHLASDASSFTTGTVMVVDGGWLAA